MDFDTVTGVLQNQRLFKDVGISDLRRVAPELVRTELRRGEYLRHSHELNDAIDLVVYGLVQLVLPSDQGAHRIMELIRPGQSMGEVMWMRRKPLPFCAVAAETTLVYRLPSATIDWLMRTSISFNRNLAEGLAERMAGLMHNIERLSMQNATQRVADYLLQSAEMQGSDCIRLELKKHLTASFLDISAETLSRVFHHLMRDRLIQVNGAEIAILSKERLIGLLQPATMAGGLAA